MPCVWWPGALHPTPHGFPGLRRATLLQAWNQDEVRWYPRSSAGAGGEVFFTARLGLGF